MKLLLHNILLQKILIKDKYASILLIKISRCKNRYTKSEMILYLDSDAAYLVAPNLRSKIAGYFYCAGKHEQHSHSTILTNGPIHIECKHLRHVFSSVAES